MSPLQPAPRIPAHLLLNNDVKMRLALCRSYPRLLRLFATAP